VELSICIFVFGYPLSSPRAAATRLIYIFSAMANFFLQELLAFPVDIP
jgi:hypothetical protein